MGYYQSLQSFRSVNNKKVGEIFVTADLIHAYLCSECVKTGSLSPMGLTDDEDGCCFITTTETSFWEHVESNHSTVVKEVNQKFSSTGIGNSQNTSNDKLQNVIVIDDDEDMIADGDEHQQQEQQQQQDITSVDKTIEKPQEFATRLLQEHVSDQANRSYSNINNDGKINNEDNSNDLSRDRNTRNVGKETEPEMYSGVIVIEEDESQENYCDDNFQEFIPFDSLEHVENSSPVDLSTTNYNVTEREVEDVENDEMNEIQEYIENYNDDCDTVLNLHSEKSVASKEDGASLITARQRVFEELSNSSFTIELFGDGGEGDKVVDQEQYGEVPTSTTQISDPSLISTTIEPTSTTQISDPSLTSTTIEIGFPPKEAQNYTNKNQNISPRPEDPSLTRFLEQLHNVEYPPCTLPNNQHECLPPADLLPFKCKYCEHRCHAHWQKVYHEKMHKRQATSRAYKCTYLHCGRRTASEKAMTTHLRRFHGETLQQQPEPEPTTKSRFQCTQCTKNYKRKHSLMAHIERTHVQTSKSNAVDTVCNAAGSSLSSPNISLTSNAPAPSICSPNISLTSNVPTPSVFSPNISLTSNAPAPSIFSPNISLTSNASAPSIFSPNTSLTSNAPAPSIFSPNISLTSNSPAPSIFSPNIPSNGTDTIMAWEGYNMMMGARSTMMAREGFTMMAQDGSTMMAQDDFTMMAQGGSTMRAHCVWRLQSPYQPALRNSLETCGPFYVDGRIT